jgi:hypothetical protein
MTAEATGDALVELYPCLKRLAFNFINTDHDDQMGDEVVFFCELIERLTDNHNGIKEVCVLVEPPFFYHWRGGRGTMVRRSFHDMPNPRGFPFGVED